INGALLALAASAKGDVWIPRPWICGAGMIVCLLWLCVSIRMCRWINWGARKLSDLVLPAALSDGSASSLLDDHRAAGGVRGVATNSMMPIRARASRHGSDGHHGGERGSVFVGEQCADEGAVYLFELASGGHAQGVAGDAIDVAEDAARALVQDGECVGS